MKKFFFQTVLLVMGQILQGQTPLPTFYSFNQNVPPAGWTLNLNVSGGSTTYATGSDGNPSCRLDATGEYVQIYFSDQADSVSFYIRSTGISPPVAPGTIFLLQQSVNGQIWYTIKQFDQNNLNGSFTFEKEAVADSAKYLRFYYQNKMSGSNIALDEVYVKKKPPGPDPELLLEYNGNVVNYNQTLYLIGTGIHAVKISNIGTLNSMNLSGVALSGANAANFNVSNFPVSLNALSSAVFNITFNAVAGGSYEAMLEFNHDAVNPVPFKIKLYGINGPLASEPQNPTTLHFSNITSYRFDVSYTPPSLPGEFYLVLRKNNQPITESPVDGTSYQVGDYIGQAQVAYVGPDTVFTPSYVIAGQNYYFKVFAFNGPPGYENYNTLNPASGSVTSLPNMIGNYWAGISSSSPSFVADLTNATFPHTQLYYSQYADYMVNQFQHRDTTGGAKVITCSYSGYEYVYYDPFTWDVMSREHVFAHSWFPSYPAQGLEYSDLHNLFPVELTHANIPRSNHPFGEVVTITSQFYGGTLGKDANNNTVYEPRESMKGDVARAIFYMLTCYNGYMGNTWTLPSFQDQQLLKQWHYQDPPDAFEMARNDYIHSIQGNRNPYIDSMHYVCFIDFYTMSYISNPDPSCLALSADIHKYNREVLIFPNPGEYSVYIFSPEEIIEIKIISMEGKVLVKEELLPAKEIRLDTSILKPGLYGVELKSAGNKNYFVKWQKTIQP